jgi:hypothetical protein
MSEPGPDAVATLPDPLAGPDPERLHEVRVLRAPVRLWDRSSQHTTELMREFALLRIGQESGTTRHHVPVALLALVADLRERYAGTSSAQEAELQAAVDSGERSHDFTYRVPASAGQACLDLLDLLDAADAFCAEGTELITSPAPADQVAFRRWYLLEFVRQLAGDAATPWPGGLD